MRSRLLSALLWLLAFGCLWLPICADAPLRSGAYLQDVTTEAATVAMITPGPERLTCQVVDASGATVASLADAEPVRRHAFRVPGLRPGAAYRYELRAEGVLRGSGPLRTPPADDRAPVDFAFLGDSGGQPWWIWLQNAPAVHWLARTDWLPTRAEVTAVGAALAAADPQFVLHLGDLVYPNGRHAHYTTGFFRPFAEVLARAPLYAVLGNHDLMDANGQQMLANLHLPRGSVTGDGRCYSFAWGAVRVIALHCDPKHGAGRFEPGHPAHEFLMAELPRCSEPWVVVMSHFPILSASDQRNRADLMQSLLPALREFEVSVYLSGHDHCYQRFATKDGPPLVVSGGGGKSLYGVRPDPAAVQLASAYHWCKAEVRGDRFGVVAIDLAGQEIDRFALELPDGARLEGLAARNPARAARIRALRAGG
ncbi:MAG: metallophosphoesterase [Planctomycetes bacterium]|nr:metallophosphoesterase [Planctomycetota bacterium]